MSAPQESRYDSIARRWLALVERRQAHLLDLCDTGRWRHYYTEANFIEEIRKVLRVRDQWAIIAGVALQDKDIRLSEAARSPRPRELSAAVPAAPRD
jgi:uncharacterized repeat protein (TIGR03809 family)